MKRYIAFAALAMSCTAVHAGQWSGEFSDAHMARIRHWEGVDNVRDLGGLVTKDGGDIAKFRGIMLER